MTTTSTRPLRVDRTRPGPALLALVVGLLTALGTLWPAPVAEASAPGYVALGDSYSAGVGTRHYVDDGTDCSRSTTSYAGILARRRHLRLTLAACAGATTADVRTDQLRSLRRSTRYVTLSVGGNDLGFAHVVSTCARPAWSSNCKGAVAHGLQVLRRRLGHRLDTLFAAVRRRSPHAVVVVVGYPRLFNGTDCNAATFFSKADQRRLNAATDELDALLAGRAAAAGLRYADPVPAFGHHAVCAEKEWVNGLSRPLSESYHPSVAGYRAYARLVAPVLFG